MHKKSEECKARRKIAVLALMARESGKLGLILLDAKRAAKHIAEIL